jgi:hypothetical protein
MTKPKINHVLHLVLTLVTLGFWAIVWLILGIVNSGKSHRCAQCGTPSGHGARGPMVQQVQQAPQAAPEVREPVQMPEIPGAEPEGPGSPDRP